MKRLALLIFLIVASAIPAWSQQTAVTATVTDPNGHAYSSGTSSASLVCAGNAQAYSGSYPIPRSVPTVGLDGNGAFSQILYDTSQLVDVNHNPLSCHYTYSVTEQCGVASFTTGALTGITGAGPVDLSTQINSFAVPLSPKCTVGYGGYVYIGPLAGIPAFCAVGQTAFITDATPGRNQYNCTSTNVWTQNTGGGGSTPAAPGNAVQVGNSTVTGLATVTCNGAYFAIDSLTAPTLLTQPCAENILGTAGFGGANPWVDTSIYGMRAVASPPPNTTASCTNGLQAVSAGSWGSFEVGDGLVLYGCGATNTLSTPGAPTVAPSLLSGPDTLNQDAVAAPIGGSTAYSYQIVARDKNGGLTAAGSAGTTSAGWTLGAETTTLSTLARSGTTVTANAASADGAAAGAIAFIYDSSDSTFDGFFQVGSALSGTSFTYPQGMNTIAGASTSATGGTVTVYNCNHITWTAVSGAWQYYIYGRTSGSLALIGVSRPGETGWNDCGSTMSAAPSLPDFVPSTPPSSATNDYLATTITSISGINITIAAAASNSTTGSEVKFDDGPNLANAYRAATGVIKGSLHIPPAPAGTSYYINSHTILANGTFEPTIFQSGQLQANETIEFAESSVGGNWSGSLGGWPCLATQFSWNCGIEFVVGTAFPAIYAGNPLAIDNMYFSVPAQGLAIELNGAIGSTVFNSNISRSTFVTTSTSDYMGQFLVGFGTSNESFDHVAFLGNDSPTYGYSITPLVLTKANLGAGSNGPGNVYADYTYWAGRGFGTNGSSTAVSLGLVKFNNTYSQALRAPLIEDGQYGFISFDLNQHTEDTSIVASVAIWGGNPSYVDFTHVGATSDEPNGQLPGCLTGSGSKNMGVTSLNVRSGCASGQNFNMTKNYVGAAAIPSYSSNGSTDSPAYGAHFSFQETVHFPTLHTLIWDLPPPTGVTATVGSGGSVPVGSWTYEVVARGIGGGWTTVSLPSTTCTTTSGNQECVVAWTGVTGAVNYTVYRAANGGGYGQTQFCIYVAALTCTDASATSAGGVLPTTAGTGSVELGPSNIITPELTLYGPLASGVSPTCSLSYASSTCAWASGIGYPGAGIPLSSGSAWLTSINYLSALTGQVLVATNAAAPTFASKGIAGRTVSGATDTILCDSSTATQDRTATIMYTDASGTTVTVPDAGSSGCGSNFVFAVIAGPGSGTVTFNRTTSSTFTVVNGSSATGGATSFTLTVGQFATVSSPDNSNWLVRLTP